MFLKVLTLLAVISLHGCPFAQTMGWSAWVAELREEALGQGVRAELFDRIFANIKPNKRVTRLDRNQPEKRLTFYEYRKTRADNYRILLGKRALKKHRPVLTEVGKDFGVDPCFIVSLWGMESSYGNFKGNFPVIPSLATLAYDSHRSEFFRKQLLEALHIVNEGHVSLKDFKGEWAGGSGHPQFLPTSWREYAVDYNNDGRKDIWHTKPDVFASIANYLVENGWETDQPWAVEVTVPDDLNSKLVGYDTKKTLKQWRRLGVTVNHPAHRDLPDNLEASLVQPYGGPTLMAFNNFRVIMRYNRSTYYAGAIGHMADRICGRNFTTTAQKR